VLKASKELFKDIRVKFDGKPLRQSWHLPFLSRSMSPSKSTNKTPKGYFLYEAQISVVVTGIDDSVWTAYGFADTYFGSKESVRRYHISRRQGRPGRPDPLAAGQIDADIPIWTPREYFLRVIEIRTTQVQRHWNFISDRVEDAVKQYVWCGDVVCNIARSCAWTDEEKLDVYLFFSNTGVGFLAGRLNAHL
jgi:hypothetical protein